MRARVGMKIRYAEDGEAWPAAFQITFIGAQEKLTSKKIVPGQFSNHLNRHAIGWIGAGGGIEHIDIPPLQISCQAIAHNLEDPRRHGIVNLTPPDFC